MSRRISPVIPGFGLTLGFSLSYLSLIVLIPLAGMFVYASQLTLTQLWTLITSRQVLLSLQLSFGTALAAAFVNGILGTLLAWVLVRYQFPGRKVIDAMIDMPFALPTAVAGIALTALYAPNGLIGGLFPFKIAYTSLGITLALIFVTLPYVARELIPLMEQQGTQEEAARLLSANGWQMFWYITLPNVKWALIYGVVLCTARAMGEFGAVSVVSGHIRGLTNTLPLHIEILYNEYNIIAAFSVAILLLLMSLVVLLLRQWSEGRLAKQVEKHQQELAQNEH
ncbi:MULTISPECIES: sulfate ABC transporter permease subunit CysT [Symbiopectobacterium]|uniref:sulfate ABC transporter permease subunit CysT n=1 Tax=Symbiopectobacterium TaxID=801 RepID=UPI001A27620D|nr:MULTISPECIES: sulfate ABC transporter permease subunit CysT [Symbiopectobacterium]MBG6248651.1 sulfate ABC transporter permease subunit CysT [Candidatus Symbiopectobacterium sp. PLON1]MBT9428670.1 sulfate ABC transporter permease subunit CysT [Candidatus Symbiopectobacterium endolongispinus]